MKEFLFMNLTKYAKFLHMRNSTGETTFINLWLAWLGETYIMWFCYHMKIQWLFPITVLPRDNKIVALRLVLKLKHPWFIWSIFKQHNIIIKCSFCKFLAIWKTVDQYIFTCSILFTCEKLHLPHYLSFRLTVTKTAFIL